LIAASTLLRTSELACLLPPLPSASKSAKPAKPAKAAAAPAATSGDLFSKALLKVARIASVDEVEGSDKLFKMTVDIGGGEIKQVRVKQPRLSLATQW
jgi:tRNA-binding EMAP/Myf-like protein